MPLGCIRECNGASVLSLAACLHSSLQCCVCLAFLLLRSAAVSSRNKNVSSCMGKVPKITVWNCYVLLPLLETVLENGNEDVTLIRYIECIDSEIYRFWF